MYINLHDVIAATQLPGEDPWGWIDEKTETYHAVFHTGNGAISIEESGFPIKESGFAISDFYFLFTKC